MATSASWTLETCELLDENGHRTGFFRRCAKRQSMLVPLCSHVGGHLLADVDCPQSGTRWTLVGNIVNTPLEEEVDGARKLDVANIDVFVWNGRIIVSDDRPDTVVVVIGDTIREYVVPGGAVADVGAQIRMLLAGL